ncbi:MAG: PAS domain S-box protein [Spirochaetes bacterium]|nr:PAS domain S-box protein [Spirochaetota bacterium]
MELASKTLLLVEDDVISGMLEADRLEHEGYNVVHVMTGEEAIDLCRVGKHGIDLILMDIDLGRGIDGTQAAREILRDHDIPVVFLTSYMEKEIVELTDTIASYGYVIKNSGGPVLDASIKMAFKLYEANRLLRLNRDNFSTMFHANPDSTSITHMVTGLIMEINKTFTNFTGYAREEALGRSAVSDLRLWFDPDDRIRMLAELESKGRVDGLEVPIRIKNGTIKTLQMSASRITYNGEPCVIIVTRDLTERKLAEAKLNTAFQQMHDIIEFLPDPTFVVDRDRRVIFWNKAMEDLTSIKKEDIIGQGDYAYALPFYRERRPILVDLVDQPSQELESRYNYVLRVGNSVYAETHVAHLNQDAGAYIWGVASPLFDSSGSKIGAIEVLHDITERLKIKQALRESESLYRLLAENTDDVIWLLNSDLCFTYISPSIRKLRGFEPDEVIGRTLEDMFTPESLKVIYELYEHKMPDVERGLNPNTRIILEEYHKNGSTVWVDNTVNVLRDPEGRLIGFMGVSKDISELKRIENELEKSLRQKEVLMKELQHRVKNNMNVIASLLNLEVDRLPDEDSRRIFHDARSRIDAMSAIYDKLVQSDDLDRIDLSDYIRDLVNMIAESYAMNKGTIRLSMNLDEVKLDIKRAVPLGLILNELITNAVKYAFPGGMSGEIGIRLRMEDGRINLGVSDNGVGLPEGAALDQAKSMGFRLINVLAKQIKGTLLIEQNLGTSVLLKFNL